MRPVCARAVCGQQTGPRLIDGCSAVSIPQVTLLNELLRNLLHFNLFEQAEKLAAKTTLPETVGNNQHARYFYYLGAAGNVVFLTGA